MERTIKVGREVDELTESVTMVFYGHPIFTPFPSPRLAVADISEYGVTLFFSDRIGDTTIRQKLVYRWNSIVNVVTFGHYIYFGGKPETYINNLPITVTFCDSRSKSCLIPLTILRLSEKCKEMFCNKIINRGGECKCL